MYLPWLILASILTTVTSVASIKTHRCAPVKTMQITHEYLNVSRNKFHPIDFERNICVGISIKGKICIAKDTTNRTHHIKENTSRGQFVKINVTDDTKCEYKCSPEDKIKCETNNKTINEGDGCKCECRNKGLCIHSTHTWDDTLCKCICKNTHACSTPTEYDQISCKCKLS